MKYILNKFTCPEVSNEKRFVRLMNEQVFYKIDVALYIKLANTMFALNDVTGPEVRRFYEYKNVKLLLVN